PLYRNVRGDGQTLNTVASGSYFRPVGTGIQAQRPTYPMFFSNVVAGSVDTPSGLQATLGALGIPLTPAAPVALSASFGHPYTPGSRTYVGQGGIFTINTQNALTYQIVLKGGSTPAHDDPAHADNRVLTGVATGLNQKVYWDGLNNAGTPMPAGGNYSFEVTGRAGEVHFPFLDVEANLSGGPTVTRLNGPNPGEATVYYDDRGYRTNGVNVGTAGGDICPSGSDTPSPAYSLLGIDSSNANYNSTGKYYRSWGAANTGNTGVDCAAGGYYGDAKGMDLWALIRSDPPSGSLQVEIVDYADVVATASIPQSVVPGGTVVIAVNFGNAGSSVANNVTYGVQLPSGLTGAVTCTGATCNYDASTGAVSISGLPTSLSAGQWTNAVTVQYTAPASGALATGVAITTTSAQATPNAADSVSGSTLVTSSGTEADVLAQVTAPLTAAPGGTVNVAVSFRNLGPLTATGLVYAMTLPGDLTGVSCAAPVTCSYNSTTGAVTVSGLPSSLAASATTDATLSYTAPGSGVVAVSATITTVTAESATGNNTASAVTTVSAVASADVTAAIAPPAQAVGGTGVSVPMTFRNLGPQVANGVTYAATLSTGLTGVSCSAPYSCSYHSGTGVVTLSGLPGTLQNGQIVNVTLAFTAPGTGTVSFSASLATSTTDNNPQNNAASAQTVLVPASYTVSFDSNGGSAVAALTNVTHGTTVVAPTSPTRVGYSFGGWYKEPALTNAWNFGTDTVTSATTLYARWQINVYSLSYAAGANGSISGATSQSVNYGGNGTAVTAAPNAGYHFVSWSDGVTTAARTDTGITSSLAVGASFAINSYSLTYTAGANGSVTGTTPQSVNHGASGASVTAVPAAGYHFVSWSDGVTTATRTDTNVTSALAVSASFAINTYTLTYTAGANGSVTGTTPQTVNHGGNGSTVTAVPAPGYRFTGWSDGVATASRTDTNVTGAITASAVFAVDAHTLTYAAGPHGSVSGAAAQTVSHGGNGTAVTAVPDAGYHFASWSDGVTTATRTDTNVTGAIAVSASFTAGHTLTYSVGGQGTLTGIASQSVVHGGSGTAVTAVPAAGFEFFRWSDGLTTATRIDGNVDADLAVTAYFSRTEERDLRRGNRHEFSILPGAALSRLRTTRGGQENTIDDPAAADYDWLLNCSGTACAFIGQRSGRYEFTFIDPAGNAQVMVFEVLPNVGFSSERQSASAGTPVHVRIVLDDLPIAAQLQVSYSVQNGAAIAAPEPADLLTRDPQLLTLNVGPGGNAQCFAAGHCSQEITFMPNASAGEIRFTLLQSAGAAIGDYATHRVDLTSPALLPLTANLPLLPGSTVTAGTPLVASLANLPAGNYRFDWSGSDAALGIASASTATVTPAGAAAGSYLVRVTVQDLDHPNRAALELQTWVRIVASGDGVRVCGAAGCDDDGTRIPFDLQAPECGMELDDPAGANAYRLQVGAKGWNWDTQGQCLETQPGYGLRLGTVSFLSSPSYGAGIDAATVRQFGNNGREATNVTDRAFTHTGLSYDFEVASLDTAGQSVAVVIPLPRNLAIPAGASWRTYQSVDGWAGFVTDARNTLHSAKRSGGECPSPVSGVWEDSPGLVAGMECVRLVIQDGGPNDADRKINAAVAAAGTLAVDTAREEVTVTSSGPKGGGGAMNPLTLLLTLLFVMRRHARALLGLVALAAMTTVHADDAERAGWSIGATAARALGDVDGDDVTRGLAALGIPATARVEDQNRFGWRAFGGYRFGKYLSVDAGYANLGKATTHISGVPVDLEEIPHVLPASGAGWELSAAGYLPVSERVELYGRFGGWYWKTLYHALETGQKRRPDADGVDALGGIGIRYRHPERWEAGLGWDRYRVDGQSVDLVGLSVIFRFRDQP
ncbi:MAG TPA: InlB B-repeat-containing protein, partial [Povalibacter sp.]|uniref:InlB B-repeat-containing protein n=1 Tax=Povalibacter sp. TaxID=1962978 RepID=UPI002C163F73